jgi:hypothetical protein
MGRRASSRLASRSRPARFGRRRSGRERRARTLSSAVHIVEVAELDPAFELRPWQFAQTHAEAVATRWARLRKEKPEVYNGRVLLMRRLGSRASDQRRAQARGRLFRSRLCRFRRLARHRRFHRAGLQLLRDGGAPRRGWCLSAWRDGPPHHERRSDLFSRRHAGSKRRVRRQGGPLGERMSRAPP